VARLRFNNVGDLTGTVNGIHLDASSAACTWDEAPGLGAVADPDIAVVVVEPGTVDEEVIWITAYTPGETGATCTRMAETVVGGAPAGTAHGEAAWVHGPTALDFADSGGGGGGGGGTTDLLGYTDYVPGVPYLLAAEATFTAIDAANLTVTFTAPASGKVFVELEASAHSAAGANILWGLLEGGVVVGPANGHFITDNSDATAPYGAGRFHDTLLVEALIPGSVHTFQWAYQVGSAVVFSQGADDMVMIVRDAGIGAGGALGDAAWTVVGAGGAPAFENGWGNAGGEGATTAKFRKLSSGQVITAGVITGGTAGDAAFHYPVGYRPLEQRTRVTWDGGDAHAGLVLVQGDGSCVPQFSGNQWLDGVDFLAEQ
jgi:hypothetical protein